MPPTRHFVDKVVRYVAPIVVLWGCVMTRQAVAQPTIAQEYLEAAQAFANAASAEFAAGNSAAGNCDNEWAAYERQLAAQLETGYSGSTPSQPNCTAGSGGGGGGGGGGPPLALGPLFEQLQFNKAICVIGGVNLCSSASPDRLEQEYLKNPTVLIEDSAIREVSSRNLEIQVGQLYNSGGGKSGQIRIDVWATKAAYDGGSDVPYPAGHRIGGFALAGLQPNYEYNSLVETVGFATPPIGFYYVTALATEYTAAKGWVVSASRALGTMQVGTAPGIITQPASKTVNAYQGVTLRVRATGSAPLSYSWLFNGTPFKGYGSHSPTVAFPSATEGFAGAYSVRVSNVLGSVISSAATLTVNYKSPAITRQPSDLTVAPRSSARFIVSATGTPPLRYQWYLDAQPVNRATNRTFLVSYATAESAATNNYWVTVSNPGGTVTSSNATLTAQ